MITSFLPSSGLTLSAIFLVSIQATTGCSDGSGGAPSTGGTSAGGSTSTTGGSSTGGGTATGGVSAGTGGASGGRAGAGGAAAAGAGGTSAQGGSSGTGAAGTGGSVEAGGPCTANCPSGKVHTCFDQCPLGACDDAAFFAATPCSTVYPSAIDDQTIYCKTGQTATYCLTTLDGTLTYYQVSCAAGSPTVTPCSGGCGVDSTGTAACGP